VVGVLEGGCENKDRDKADKAEKKSPPEELGGVEGGEVEDVDANADVNAGEEGEMLPGNGAVDAEAAGWPALTAGRAVLVTDADGNDDGRVFVVTAGNV
jgi:hypothetical protein